METAMLPEQQEGAAEDGAEEQDGAPVQEAEASRTTKHLFEYSLYVHAGDGAEDCDHATDGKCDDEGHFHAWVCLPNSLQHRDILEKARAAKARRKRSLRDAGADGRPPSDAYVMLESDLDDALDADTTGVIDELAGRSVRKRMPDLIREAQEADERFENYYQDAEEWRRMAALDEEARPADEFKVLQEEMTAFEDAVKALVEQETERERDALRSLPPEGLRDVLRSARIEGDTAEAHLNTYYTWLGFIGTRVCAAKQGIGAKRYFGALEDFRNASPEAVDAVDNALRDLEARMNRGDAAGN